MPEYIPTIGLEIHVELKTKTKMFCDSPNNPEELRPNTNVCPVCLGHPGTLPTMNMEAIKSVIRVGMALNGEINPETKFDRKNYFYPDLPKGYQISQYDKPLVIGGSLNGITLTRIHLEEDTGRLLHDPKTNSSLVDYNRAGVPLMELVTEPEVKSAEEAVAFARELQLILRYLGVSDADMERGQMRVEVNISLGKWSKGMWKQGTKVEIKNLNSFGAVSGCIEYEIKRQAEVMKTGKVHQETRGWDDAKKITVSQRSKEEAHDYRYFPEPDMPPFETAALNLEELKMSLPELPAAKRDRFKEQYKQYKLSDLQLDLLTQDRIRSEYFEEMDSELLSYWESWPYKEDEILRQNVLINSKSRAFNYLVNDLPEIINNKGLSLDVVYRSILPKYLAKFAFLVEFGNNGPLQMEEGTKIGRAATKEILREMLETKEDPEEIIKKSKEKGNSFHTISDESELEKVVQEIIAENPAAVADYKKGKTATVQFMIGQAMKKLKGRGSPDTLKVLFEKNLQS